MIPYANTLRKEKRSLPTPCLINEGELERARIVGKLAAFYLGSPRPTPTPVKGQVLNRLLSVRKRRCIPTDSAGLCQLCKLLSVPCSLTIHSPERRGIRASHPIEDSGTTKDGDASRKPSSSFASSVLPSLNSKRSSLTTTKTLLTELVDLYFRLIHNTPHTLFHESSFLSELESERIPKFILLGMIALSARYVSTVPHQG
jgi:hypothetical protein